MGLYTKGQERCYVKGNSTTCEKAAVNGYYESILPPGYKGKILNEPKHSISCKITCAPS